MDEGHEHHVEFVEAGEDSPEPLEATEESLNLIASAVQGSIIFPRRDTVLFGWHHWSKTKLKRQLSCFFSFVGSVHDQTNLGSRWRHRLEQATSFRSVMGLARGKAEGYGRPSICGNHMNLGGPTASGFADGLWAVFFNAPVPSG